MRLSRSAIHFLLPAPLLIACHVMQAPPSSVTIVPTVHVETPTATYTPAPTSTSTPDPLASELPLGDLAYTLPLTIRHLTPTSATLFFELDRPTDGVLFYQTAGLPQSGREALSAGQTRHQIVLKDLTPGTTYQLKVGAQTDQSTWVEPSFREGRWGPVTFHTPSDAGPLRFGVIGDASFGDPVTASLVEQMAATDLDFVLHTGDVVDETDTNVNPFDSYSQKFYATFAPLLHRLPVYTVLGNHDYDADIRWHDQPFYFNAFPPFDDPAIPSTGHSQYYAFSYQGLQFVMLDSQVLFGVAGRAEQEAWLAARLADPRFRATIAVFHVSPYSSSSVHPTECLRVRETWAPVLEAAKVSLVFSGHTHQYERLQSNGVTYIVSGGGSATLYARGELLPQSQVFARASHFVLVEVDAGSFEIAALSVTGEEIDRTSIPIQ
jgi:predicted phosphodiesterase